MDTTTLKAGILPLYLELYENLRPGDYEAYYPFIDEIAGLVRGAGLEPVTAEVAYNAGHVEKARDLFAREGISVLLPLHLCYSPSLLVADFLETSEVPVLFVDTTPAPSFEKMDDSYLMRNHGIHGVMDITSVLKSRGISYEVVSGHRDDPEFQERLQRKLKAIGATSLFKHQRIGITGKPFDGMGDFAVEFESLSKDFGSTVMPVELERLLGARTAVTDTAIDTVIEEDATTWDVSLVEPEDHREAVRSFLALKSIVQDEGITGYTMNFQHITEGMATPFYACSRLMAEGIGYGGEGDVLTASLGGPLNWLAGAAKFDEFFCADWKNDRILMSHMGESDPRFVKPGSSPYLTVRDGFTNPRPSVIYRFEAEPGEVTYANLCPIEGGGYRLVSGLLDIADTPLLDEIIAPHYQVGTRKPVGKFLEEYGAAGGGHHLYIARGDILEELALFSRILGFENIVP